MRRLLTIPALFLLSAALQAGSLQVTAVRAWSFPGITRVAVEVNGDFTFHSDRAHNPERIFFDLDGAVPRIGAHRLLKKEIGDKLVKRVRVAETQPGITRIVIDLESPVEFTASQLDSPNRLMVEIHPAGAPVVNTNVVNTKEITAAPPPQAPVRVAVMPDTTTAQAFRRAAETKQVLPDPPVVRPSAHTADLQLASSLTRALGLKINRIVIDAGHGGHDTGTIGVRRTRSRRILVLDVALRLGKLVQERLGAEVVYTRSDDTFVPLEERTAIANRSHADLFLSIHANSSPASEVAGVETYYLNFTNSPDAMNVAARENAVSEKSVFELKDLIQKISLHDKIEESKQFADCGPDFPAGVHGAVVPGGSQSRRAQGAFCGADRRVHAVGAGGDRLPHQRAAGSAARQSPNTGRSWPKRCIRGVHPVHPELSHFEWRDNT